MEKNSGVFEINYLNLMKYPSNGHNVSDEEINYWEQI